MQVICTVLSADLVTPHDILCINGASAALMISPLPFLGPIGAVRVGLIDGELVVNPSLESSRRVDARPDRRGDERGAHHGRGRGRRDPRGDDSRGARAGARRDPQDLRGARGSARAGRQAEVGRCCDLTAELDEKHGAAIRAAIAEAGLREAAHVVEELVEAEAPAITMASTEEDIVRGAHRSRPASRCSSRRRRRRPSRAPLREQFEADLRELTDAEQDSKELKSAKRDLLYERITEEIELPFPMGQAPAEGEPPVKDSVTRSSSVRATRSTRTSSGRRSRSTSGVPTVARQRRSVRSGAR